MLYEVITVPGPLEVEVADDHAAEVGDVRDAVARLAEIRQEGEPKEDPGQGPGAHRKDHHEQDDAVREDEAIREEESVDRARRADRRDGGRVERRSRS